MLDTHVALWAITDSPKLSKKAREMIELPKSSIWISAATIWEIAIKRSLGRGDMRMGGRDAGVSDVVATYGICLWNAGRRPRLSILRLVIS